MISLGRNILPLYPDSGIAIQNCGTIIFNGSCHIGNNSAIVVGKHGNLTFGNKFGATSTLRLVCYNHITFDDKTSVGWDCTFMDTDLHRMKKREGGYTQGFGAIKIGKGNWFGNRCVVLKNTETADYCTFSACSVLNKRYTTPYAVYAQNSVELKREGLWRDCEDDVVEY